MRIKRYILGTGIGLIGMFVLLTGMNKSALAATLLTENFSSSPTITFAGINLITASTSDDNLNQWLGDHWTIQNSGGNYFAQENEPGVSDLTNMMYYGVSAAGITSGTSITLDFSYEIANRTGTVYIAGLNYGVHNLDQFPGFFDDAQDGVVIQKVTLPADYANSGWMPGHLAFTMPAAYDVLVVGWEMGGSSGFRAIDDINFVAAVPEPSTLLLLGSGLLGLVSYGRKRLKK